MNKYSVSVLFASALTAACTLRPPGEILLSLAEEDQPAFLLSTVREAGFVCNEVQRSVQTGKRWEIACGDARAYVVVVEENGSMCIEVRWPAGVDQADDLVVQSTRGRHPGSLFEVLRTRSTARLFLARHNSV